MGEWADEFLDILFDQELEDLFSGEPSVFPVRLLYPYPCETSAEVKWLESLTLEQALSMGPRGVRKYIA